MGKGDGDKWDDEYPDVRQSQPPPYSERDERGQSSKSKCPTCCIKCKDCLMSPECGRALQISSVIAFCASCIRMWM